MNKRISTLLLICLFVVAISGCLAVVPQNENDLAENISSINNTNVISTDAANISKDVLPSSTDELQNDISQDENHNHEDARCGDIDYLDEAFDDAINADFQYINQTLPKMVWKETYEKECDLTYYDAVQIFYDYIQLNKCYFRDENGNAYLDFDDPNRPKNIK